MELHGGASEGTKDIIPLPSVRLVCAYSSCSEFCVTLVGGAADGIAVRNATDDWGDMITMWGVAVTLRLAVVSDSLLFGPLHIISMTVDSEKHVSSHANL